MRKLIQSFKDWKFCIEFKHASNKGGSRSYAQTAVQTDLNMEFDLMYYVLNPICRLGCISDLVGPNQMFYELNQIWLGCISHLVPPNQMHCELSLGLVGLQQSDLVQGLAASIISWMFFGGIKMYLLGS